MLDKLLYASYAIGKPIIKYGRKGFKLAKKTTPKSVKKFGRKSKKFLGKEYQEMKHFAKTNPEMFAGSVAIGGATGYGLKKSYQALTNKDKKKKTIFGKLPKSDPRYKIMKEKGWV